MESGALVWVEAEHARLADRAASRWNQPPTRPQFVMVDHAELVSIGVAPTPVSHASAAALPPGHFAAIRRSPRSFGGHFEHRGPPDLGGGRGAAVRVFAAGVSVGGLDGLARSAAEPIAMGIVSGLVVGKCGRTIVVAGPELTGST